MNLATKLRDRTDPIAVGFIGAGIFGSQVIHTIEATPGMETVATADLDTGLAVWTFERAGVDAAAIGRADSAAGLDAVLEDGRRAVTDDGLAVVDADVDVVVDATGDPNVAARHAYRTLTAGTHFVNVSVEADTVCGPLLAAIADRNDVTYTLAYGDQPGKIVELCEWAETTGFEVIAAGKAARRPEYHGTPDDALERHGSARSFGDHLEPNPIIYNSFIDGTKDAVESVAAANALDLSIDTPGLHRPELSLTAMPETFRPDDDGGVLGSTGVIDIVTPTDADFSVFVVTRTESAQLREYYSLRPAVTTSEDGAYQVFSTPSHFASETTVSIASAALVGEPTGAPRAHNAEVVAAAKRDLDPGDELDGGGGYTIYGLPMDADAAASAGLVPFELLAKAEVTAPIARDERVTFAAVDIDTDQPLYHLRQLQGF